MVPATEVSDEQLIAAAAREGSDGPAFSALVARHRDRVWRICFRLMGNEHDAQDAAQEVLVRLFVERARFEGRSKFTTWLHGIALRTCLALRRSRGRRQRRESAADGAALDRQADRHAPPAPGLAEEVMKLLDCLSEEDRALVILKYAEGYEHDDLAEMFGLGISACKMRISRAREKVLAHARERDQPSASRT
jgi:RNA polymerase sigma-70 factor (ECF subfamily)